MKNSSCQKIFFADSLSDVLFVYFCRPAVLSWRSSEVENKIIEANRKSEIKVQLQL